MFLCVKHVIAESWHLRIPLFLNPAIGSMMVHVLSAEQTMTKKMVNFGWVERDFTISALVDYCFVDCSGMESFSKYWSIGSHVEYVYYSIL